MAWSSHILSSGSRDRNILQRDVRAPEDYVHKLVGHRSEVGVQLQGLGGGGGGARKGLGRGYMRPGKVYQQPEGSGAGERIRLLVKAVFMLSLLKHIFCD